MILKSVFLQACGMFFEDLLCVSYNDSSYEHHMCSYFSDQALPTTDPSPLIPSLPERLQCLADV